MARLADRVKIFAVLNIPLGFNSSPSPVMGRRCQLRRIFPLTSGVLHTFDGSDSSH